MMHAVTSAKKTFFPWVKFNWNVSNRIKDFWSATRLPFQSKHYAQGELCYCSTPFIHQWAILALTSFQKITPSHHFNSLLQTDNFCHFTHGYTSTEFLGFLVHPLFAYSCFNMLSNCLTFKSVLISLLLLCVRKRLCPAALLNWMGLEVWPGHEPSSP